jgi:hypothetical protein
MLDLDDFFMLDLDLDLGSRSAWAVGVGRPGSN